MKNVHLGFYIRWAEMESQRLCHFICIQFMKIPLHLIRTISYKIIHKCCKWIGYDMPKIKKAISFNNIVEEIR